MSTCSHEDTVVRAEVAHISDTIPESFMLDVSVQCRTCREQFIFIGDMPVGVDPRGPAIGPDGTSLRIPIRPGSEPRAPVKGMLGYRVTASADEASDKRRTGGAN